MPQPRPRKNTPSLQNRLVLHRFVCREFGYEDMGIMLERLADAAPDPAANGENEYAQALYLNPARAAITPDQLAQYDANIAAHSRRLRITADHGRTWKPHQYLALLFTEHYLHRYFYDPEALCTDLNAAKSKHPLTASLPDYEPDDLRTLAFQSATGSGKTLLMHAHVLQYRHYLNEAGGRLNNIVLVTPNEQMSVQHEREMRASGLPARLFSSEGGGELFDEVKIIDLNKLAEKKGVKRVAVSHFGGDNLVLVDEGHLGASGKVWREHRGELSRGGFTFEYSATFNQIPNKSGNSDLLNAYGKCLLFDYSYARFHKDGYGKDYAILNLPDGVNDDNSNMYLLGCLLTFYSQCRIWRDKGARWQAFNLAKPLWVFLGKTVKGSSKADQETRSDVVLILRFLGWVLAHGDLVRPMIARLLAGESGLRDEADNDYFADRFPHLPHDGEDLYADLCKTLFHGAGQLHVVYLTAGEGELHLRTADNDPFGVVNVGDSAALYKLLAEKPNPDWKIEREMGFAARLFADVDRPDSTVNVVIGARRFIAGWNSWRVSTMGLMHVGVGEGPEIIQMFGRGVRLKGWNMSLKRHRESGAERPADGDMLAELEKLHIFGLRANYMQTFRNLLQAEGMQTEQETFPLPVTWNFGKEKDLKLIRLKEGSRYDFSDERPVLPKPTDDCRPFVRLDLYSRLQSVASNDTATSGGEARTLFFLKPYAAFFDMARVYNRLLLRKRQRNWRNLVIERATVEKLLQDDDWYELNMPPERRDPKGFAHIRGLEDAAVDLITKYADQFWRKQRRQWEHQKIEVITLKESDPNNVVNYKLHVNSTEQKLVDDARELANCIREERPDYLQPRYAGLKIGFVETKNRHAYQPLLYAKKERVVTVQPIPLDENEKKVVEGLAELADNDDGCLRGKELFLIRNLTRGRGVSFFDDYGYYPDFIVWLKGSDCQHVLFLDPKGLSRYEESESKKVQLHTAIKETEKQVRKRDPNLRLCAYVLSVTPASEIAGGGRSASYWKQKGVYFLNETDCLKQVIKHARGQTA